MTISNTSPTLLTEMRKGKQSAWRDFHRRYAAMLLAIAKRKHLSDADALEVVQDIEVTVFRTFQRLAGPFDRSRRPFKAWLRAVAKNKIVDFYRRRKMKPDSIDTASREAIDLNSCAEIETIIDQEWARSVVGRALSEVAELVPATTYQVLELTVIHDQPAKRVAELMETTVNAVHVKKCKGLKELRRAIRRIEQEEEETTDVPLP